MTHDEKVEFISERVTSKLDLNAEQRQKFVDMAELVAVTLQEIKPTKDERMQEITSMLEEPSFNQARALELIQQKTQLVNERAPLLITSLATFLDSLSAEQKQDLQQFVQHRHKHHRSDP